MRKFLACLTILLSLAGRAESEALKVVTTLSTYADIARSIGGSWIEVSSIASPKFNPHFIEPRPSDVLKLKRADLFIHSGLDLEAWREALVNAAARPEIRPGGDRQLDLSAKISLLEIPEGTISRAEGDIHLRGNPHYWLDPRNGVIIAREIEGKLIELDPDHTTDYRANFEAFSSAIEKRIVEWREKLLPLEGKELIGYHNEWIYLLDFGGIRMKRFLEPKPGIPPTPKQLEALTAYSSGNRVEGIVRAPFQPAEPVEELSKRTGIKAVTLSQSVGDLEGTEGYVAMIDYDIAQLTGLLRNE